MKTAKHLIVSGRVQGVGYRAWFYNAAGRMNLGGWVRNRTDGTVEAVLQGTDEDIDALVEAAYKGPVLARVNNVAISDTEYDGPAGALEIRPTE